MRAKIRTPSGETTIIDAPAAEVCRLAREPGYVVHLLAPETLETFPPIALGPREPGGWRRMTMEPEDFRRGGWLYNDITDPKARA